MHIKVKNQVHNHSENLIKPEKIENKNILIDEVNFENLVIYFTGYVSCKSIKTFSLYFYKLMGKIEENEGKIFNS